MKTRNLRGIPHFADSVRNDVSLPSGEKDLGFGFDYEEGVGVVMALGAEFLDGFVYGGSLRGEDDGAVVAADEVEAALLLD